MSKTYRKYLTAGHTLLHEITHLDKVGAFLENDPDDVNSHGTFDYETLGGVDYGDGRDVLWKARQLQVLYNQNPDRTDCIDDDGQRTTRAAMRKALLDVRQRRTSCFSATLTISSL